MKEQIAENDELPERDDMPADEHEHEPDYQADRETGFQAGLSGKEYDDDQTAAWQRGWADAQE